MVVCIAYYPIFLPVPSAISKQHKLSRRGPQFWPELLKIFTDLWLYKVKGCLLATTMNGTILNFYSVCTTRCENFWPPGVGLAVIYHFISKPGHVT